MCCGHIAASNSAVQIKRLSLLEEIMDLVPWTNPQESKLRPCLSLSATLIYPTPQRSNSPWLREQHSRQIVRGLAEIVDARATLHTRRNMMMTSSSMLGQWTTMNRMLRRCPKKGRETCHGTVCRSSSCARWCADKEGYAFCSSHVGTALASYHAYLVHTLPVRDVVLNDSVSMRTAGCCAVTSNSTLGVQLEPGTRRSSLPNSGAGPSSAKGKPSRILLCMYVRSCGLVMDVRVHFSLTRRHRARLLLGVKTAPRALLVWSQDGLPQRDHPMSCINAHSYDLETPLLLPFLCRAAHVHSLLRQLGKGLAQLMLAMNPMPILRWADIY
jgi:hypothetical protein